jgi:hypothetical protein
MTIDRRAKSAQFCLRSGDRRKRQAEHNCKRPFSCISQEDDVRYNKGPEEPRGVTEMQQVGRVQQQKATQRSPSILESYSAY